jgi:glycosyltransferase involved in cell wall biosynthesis
LPILSSLGGEQRALIDRHHIGLHYAPHHPESLIERVSWLAEHPGERRAMGVRAASLFEASYKADTIYANLAEYIESIAAPDKRKR